MNKKRVYINGRFLTQPLTGVQRFAKEVTLRLSQADEYETTVLTPKNVNTNIKGNNLKVKRIGVFNGYLWEQIDLPLFLFFLKSPLLINLANLAPVFYFNKLLTLHDTAYLDTPQSFNWRFKFAYKLLVPLLLISSKKILTVSEFSKSRIIRNYKFVSPNSIKVIFNGSNFRLEKYNNQKKKKIILSVASHDKRKNTALLVSAFNLFNKKGLYRLILVGKQGKAFKRMETNEYINVEYRDNVSDRDLEELYLSCDLCVNLSSYEGFGLPVLEALTLGAKVLCSDIEVFRELYGDNVFFTKITDPSIVSSSINRALSSNSLPALDINKYSWRKTADNLSLIIKKL